ncbi:sulfite reductase flavoprotein subunit alpha [Stenotrophomonas sp. MMGLT7]|uniref:sulfite reductase subunit alpha n=1 Tax=Stenotrophomonas sp. MMGLT7 TaxID=2901227 RepID=UPI001E51DADF|nr:sulfite reductase flavoprotein subunit alpha [Stenotrophomonas sp. MMGLT7]MCD7099353.1 sulfite reductase flavoprotein subunit alpha [Stenotrophomonas sp. MMGLT7]
MSTSRIPRATWGNLAVGALLLAIAGWLLGLHDSGWWVAAPQRRQVWIAVAAVLAYAGFCALVAWRSREPRTTAAAAASGKPELLVAWASQSGFAQDLAARSVALLRDSGQPARQVPLERLDAATLATAGRILFVASTTGEGDPPDHALPFLRQVMDKSTPLPQLHYAVLALGDRKYGDFCQFGRELDAWLRHQGAHPLCDRLEVDNADADTLRRWQHLLGQIAGSPVVTPDWAGPEYQHWRLQRRRQTNPGSIGGAAFDLTLVPDGFALPQWQAGDIAEVGPRHDPAVVAEWLRSHHLDGDAPVAGHRNARNLRELASRSQLPQEGVGADVQALAATLKPLPHREYSVASVPAEGEVRLLLRRQLGADGRPGTGSGWLCDYATVGGPIAMRLRSNPAFHPPAAELPLILIGNGTGIAGLRAQLRARIEAGARRNWLLFGERQAACDDHYGQDLRHWQAEGWLERLDAVFSRDGGRYRYVQDALADAMPMLREWVDAGAAIYVCGSLRHMAPGVDGVIEQALGAERKEALLLQGRYRRDVY